MAESKQHGRRRAEPVKRKDRRRSASVERPRLSIGRATGITLAATGVVLSLTAPSLIPTEAMERTGVTSDAVVKNDTLNISLISLASDITTQMSRVTVTADPTASVSFAREGLTSTRNLDKKLEAVAKKVADEKLAADEKVKQAAMTAGSVKPATAERTLSHATPIVSNKTLSAPLRKVIPVSGFGPRMNPISGEAGEIHTGQDYAIQCGTEVIASAGGVVVYSQWHEYGGGNRIEINHGNGLVTSYNHLESSSVKVGQKVERGDAIGKSGTTGSSTGCHLHFEVLINDEKVDPLGWL